MSGYCDECGHQHCICDEINKQMEKLIRDKERIIRELKSEVNEFLFPRLPDCCTLKEMEDLACEIHQAIYAIWEKLVP
jgi:hypothetical protein